MSIIYINIKITYWFKTNLVVSLPWSSRKR